MIRIRVWIVFLFNGVKWNHICSDIYVRPRHALKRHIYTCIFGITCSSRGMPETFIQPPHIWAPVPETSSGPSQHAPFNQLTFISFLNGPLWTIFIAQNHLCPPRWVSSIFCIKGLWCVSVSTRMDVVPTSQTAPNMSRVHRSSTVLYIM